MAKHQDMLEKILNRDIRSCAKLLRWIEDGLEEARPFLKDLYPHTGKAFLMGITGNPGAGKSTLINELISGYRKQGKSVAVVAIDPSSPFTGGSILGDRIRMQSHATDKDVFIRSFANRGHLGGLASTTHEVVQVLDAVGWDIVLVETVGVGQDEVDIHSLVNTTVVIMAPGMGDEIQAIKAGILEIADIFVVNKADYDGADRTVRELQSMLELIEPSADKSKPKDQPIDWSWYQGSMKPYKIPTSQWTPKVIKTVAISNQGIDELLDTIEQHKKAYKKACKTKTFIKRKLSMEFFEIFRRLLLEKGLVFLSNQDYIKNILDQLLENKSDPYTLAEKALAELID